MIWAMLVEVRGLDRPGLRPAELADREVARDPHGEPQQAVRRAIGLEPRCDLPHAEQRFLKYGFDVHHRRERRER
jgi:hypothetical protein